MLEGRSFRPRLSTLNPVPFSHLDRLWAEPGDMRKDMFSDNTGATLLSSCLGWFRVRDLVFENRYQDLGLLERHAKTGFGATLQRWVRELSSHPARRNTTNRSSNVPGRISEPNMGPVTSPFMLWSLGLQHMTASIIPPLSVWPCGGLSATHKRPSPQMRTPMLHITFQATVRTFTSTGSQRLSKDPGRFPEVPKGSQRFPEVPKGSQRLPEVPRGAQGFPKVPKGSQKV